MAMISTHTIGGKALLTRTSRSLGCAVPVRYAYDFCPVNEVGLMYKDDNPYKKENWYGYGAAVVAPGAGIVVAAVNDTPENDYKDKAVVYAPIPESEIQRSLGGNYVVIDHGNGEFGYFAHMRPGS